MKYAGKSPGTPKADDLAFHASDEPTLGAELEVQIVDRETGDLAPGAVQLLKLCEEESISGVTAELMQSQLEFKTDICRSVAGVRDQWLPALRRVRNLAESQGYDLALGGTHPFHRTTTSAIFPSERYERARDQQAWLIYQRVVFGLHVHVGVPSGDMAIGVINVLVQYLPHLLALSANSPFWQGLDTGLASCREVLYGLVPHAGLPHFFSKWKDFRNYYQVMRDCKALHSFKDIYWDIRPRPDFGTIEFRICDTPPTVAQALALVALIRALVILAVRLLEERPQVRRGDLRKHWITRENKWLASRYGLAATFIRTPGGKRGPLVRAVEEMIHRLEPIAHEYGDDPFLTPLRSLDHFESGAQRQRRLFREKGDWKVLIGDMTERLKEELNPSRRAAGTTHVPSPGTPGEDQVTGTLGVPSP
ncbi:MAG: YbdK family carboxylate-amine ligase [Planctomycetes bacterium]|nr:YbdK family carboxylate-amine ligase [Planctomycetota bacterium]